MSVKECDYQVGDLVLITPLIFGAPSGYREMGQVDVSKEPTLVDYLSEKELGIITSIEDTLDAWYHKQDKYKHTYTILTTAGSIRKFFKHEIEPTENEKYYTERKRR